MSKHALFLQHRTKAGARDAVQKVWQKCLQPAIAENPGHELYVYSFGDDPDRICAFQVHASFEAANAFLKSPAYRAYEQEEVTPLLEGAPTVEVLQPQWIKAGSDRHRSQGEIAMMPTITAFASSPDKGQGLARDMRVRWALEEVGQSYDVRLLSFKELKEPAHRALNPFGSIPTYEEGDLALFESGGIVHHIAEQHAGLLPKDAEARARAVTWMFAALNTIEPPIVEHEQAGFFEKDRSWYQEHLAMIERRIRDRLGCLSNRLGAADWLDGDFSAGDVLMVLVLRRLDGTGIVEEYKNLADYVARGKARPGYKRAFAAQAAVFTDANPGSDKLTGQ